MALKATRQLRGEEHVSGLPVAQEAGVLAREPKQLQPLGADLRFLLEDETKGSVLDVRGLG
jgi:hypothetical protein